MFDDLIQLDGRTLLIAGAVFGLIISVWLLMVLSMWRRHRGHEDTMRERLAFMDENSDAPRVLRLWRDGKETTTLVAGKSAWKQFRKKVESIPTAAGWQVPMRSLVLGVLGVMCLVFAIAFAISQSAIVAIASSAIIPIAFSIYITHRISSEQVRFEQQFVESLDLIARSLKAGHPLIGAFRLAAEELNAPVSTLFAELCQEQSMGIDLEQSLKKVSASSRCSDVNLFATSIVMQMRSGGNLAEMMERLAEVIRDRIRLSRRVQVVTSQVQLSKRILLALPILMFVILNLTNPAHMVGLYTTDLGNQMLAAGIGMMLCGWWVMNQMIKIKY